MSKDDYALMVALIKRLGGEVEISHAEVAECYNSQIISRDSFETPGVVKIKIVDLEKIEKPSKFG